MASAAPGRSRVTYADWVITPGTEPEYLDGEYDARVDPELRERGA